MLSKEFPDLCLAWPRVACILSKEALGLGLARLGVASPGLESVFFKEIPRLGQAWPGLASALSEEIPFYILAATAAALANDMVYRASHRRVYACGCIASACFLSMRPWT